jgi:hypothetical protein
MATRTAFGTVFHLPKTGGTWFSNALLAAKPGGSSLGVHVPSWVPRSPLEGARHPFIGTVRDPWTWYASLFKHCMKHKIDLTPWTRNGDPTWSAVWREVLYGMTHPEEARLEEKNLGVLVPLLSKRPLLSVLLDGGSGFYSFYVSYMYGDVETHGDVLPASWSVDVLLDQAVLAEQAKTVLGVDLGRSHEGPDYTNWYDDEMHGWVQRRESAVCELFGYVGQGAGFRLPLISQSVALKIQAQRSWKE